MPGHPPDGEATVDPSEAFPANFPDPVVSYAAAGPRAGEWAVAGTNGAFERRFGTVDPGTPLSAGVPPEGGSTDALVEHADASEGYAETVSCETPEGTADFLRRVVPASGRAGGYVVYTDISEQRRRERELLAQRDRLEEFASVVSHDLRNPLDVAEAHVEAARDDRDGPHLERIDHALERMEEIIDDVLMLARQGDIIEGTEPVPLDEVVADAWSSVETDAAVLRTGDDLPVVECDPERLRELLENLFRNSMEHGATDDGSSVEIAVDSLDGGFYVADDGPGVPPGDRQRVFESGYSTTSSTGLGLAIVSRIAEAHGWSVSVTESAAGGARVEIEGVDRLVDGL